MGWITKFTALRFFLGGIETYLIHPTAWSYIRSLGQSKTFLAFVLSSYDFGCVIAGPLIGAITDHSGDPRLMAICCCVFKVLAYVTYSVNFSAYFPLLGRFLSGLSSGITAILLGQVALQTDEKSLRENFIFLESVYCIGSAFGPMLGSFISFDVNIFGWEINDNNSPGIILAIVWLIFLIFLIFSPSGTWMVSGAHVDDDEQSLPLSNDKDDKRRTAYHEDGDRRLNKPDSLSWILDSRILTLLFLIFCSEVFSSTATFYVPIFGMDHFHLHLIHIKLLFLNCTLFTLLVFLSFYVASEYASERKLFNCVVDANCCPVISYDSGILLG
ncbi:SPX domain-containing membrane protein OsI_32082-like [Dendronephthya gigantea]|uniref:SPX domain-containing membrane protein OsI_32082-like n=1 Tax=Dendronephthya gigantea TaxID=151771 RepID=UPI00106AB7AD|nr:SPX domain-containing membrane protein OsI_32082-like [Dendronephthya gigantea]